MGHSASRQQEVGRVVALWRYPVKSMGAEALERADVSWHGVAGDRRWAFVREGLERSGFPWLTIRENAEMGNYRTSFAELNLGDGAALAIVLLAITMLISYVMFRLRRARAR